MVMTLGKAPRSALSVLLCSGLLAPGSAFAQADPRVTEARKACGAGNVEVGVGLLAEIYQETKNPTALYNQGRCLQQNNKGREAAAKFREYLATAPNLSAEERTKVEGFVRELDPIRLAEPPPAPVQPVAPPPAVKPPPAVVARPTPAVEPPTASVRDADASVTTAASDETWTERNARSLQIAGIATAAVGVLGIGMGVYFGTRVGAAEDDLKSLSAQEGLAEPGAWQRAEEKGKSAQTMQWVGYGLGAALIGAGTAAFFVGRNAEAKSRDTALVPLLTPTSAGAGLVGRF